MVDYAGWPAPRSVDFKAVIEIVSQDKYIYSVKRFCKGYVLQIATPDINHSLLYLMKNIQRESNTEQEEIQKSAVKFTESEKFKQP